MAQFEETKGHESIYVMFRSCIYLILIFELIVNLPIGTSDPIIGVVLNIIKKIGFFNSPAVCKVMELVCIVIVCIGTKAKKDPKFNLKKMVIYPLAAGISLIGLSLVLENVSRHEIATEPGPVRWTYALTSTVGLILTLQALDAIAKNFSSSLGKDKFNFENESFSQSRELVKNEYSVNIPMFFYHKGKMHDGWINITNPFRATIVLGTPGSGKSFGIIDPFIRQHSAKGFAMMVYDYKYPALAKNLFYQYLKNRKMGKLPANCSFRVINFSDVRYSNRINPIQRKYIPDLASASETAATLVAALNKGGGDKKGGSEAFFTNSAENFLAAIIYFFVTFRPTGYKNGQRLRRFAMINGVKREIVYRDMNNIVAVDEKNNVVHDFNGVQSNGDCRYLAIDENGQSVDLVGLDYLDTKGDWVNVSDVWHEDRKGRRCEPDTITGYFSSMPHVLAFLGHSYDPVFQILMRHEKIMSLMQPFQSAYENNANDQLEGMVGTLRVNAARLVSPEAYWVFSADDFDLKISEPTNPSYLVIANDPEKEQVIGSLNALILNRLITRINSKGNLPVSIIVDELPTLYFHKIDRLIGTARSNKVAVTLGFQELPQLEADYGKVGMQKIITTCGNIFAGAARNKETLEWLSNDVFGKVKQISESITIDQSKISRSLSERMDALVPAAKIADMATGWLAGQAARDFSATSSSAFNSINLEQDNDFRTTKYFCKTNFNLKEIKREEEAYVELPMIHPFKDAEEMETALIRNFRIINGEIQSLIDELYIPDPSKKRR